MTREQGKVHMQGHLHQPIPTDVQRTRAARPFPLDRLVLSEHHTGLLRLLARVWVVVATAGLAVLAWYVGVPSNPGRGDWDIYAQLGLLALAVIGVLVSWRWEGAGATLVMLVAAGLGALAAAEYTELRAFLVFVAFLVPSVLFWLVWQRTKAVWQLVVLAAVLVLVLGGSGYSASRVYDTYFGPVQPESSLTAIPVENVTWAWSGATTTTSFTVVAALADPASTARLVVDDDANLSDPVQVDPARSGEAVYADVRTFAVTNLDPDTEYWYAVEVDGTIDRSRIGHVRTFPETAASFTFAFGSCANSGSSGAVFDTVRETNPLFFLSTGDLFYANIGVNDPSLYRDAFDQTLTAPAQAALYLGAPIAYVWDDHDYGPNDADGTSASKVAAQANYREVVPHYPLAEGEAIYQAFSVGRVYFIVTDTSSYRSPATDPDGPGKTMLGAGQQAWLEQQLLAANGTYPVIIWVNSQPWIGASGTDAVGWGAYATERREIADFIVENRIEGLSMLSGDAHMLAIDDGSNNQFASGGGPSFPVFHAAALDRHGSVKGGPYSEGTYPAGGQFGVVTVNDTGGDTIEVVWSGRNWEGEEIVSYRFTVAADPVGTPAAQSTSQSPVAWRTDLAIRRQRRLRRVSALLETPATPPGPVRPNVHWLPASLVPVASRRPSRPWKEAGT